MAWCSFYLYFPEKGAAETAGQRLTDEAYEVDVRMGADEVNWLALAEKDIPRHQLDALEAEMEKLATELGGEYDGHEIDVAGYDSRQS